LFRFDLVTLTFHENSNYAVIWIVQKYFQTSFLGQEYLIAGYLQILMDAFWIIKRSFSLLGTKLARNQQENYPIFMMIFEFCPFYG
jgi:hypothetical protein